MASASQLPPPPGAQSPDAAPTDPAAASPAAASPSPQMQQGTQLAIDVVSKLRTIAKAFPATASEIQQINDLMRSVTAKMMAGAQSAEPSAPPNAG